MTLRYCATFALSLAALSLISCRSHGNSLLPGNGTTDDSARLQRELDRWGAIRLRRGTYTLDRPLEVRLAEIGPASISGAGATIVMRGPGPAIRITGTHRGTASPKTLQDEVWTRQRTPLVDGIEIVGAHPEACGVELHGTMQPTLSRVTIRRVLHGIRLVERNRNVVISGCHVYDNRGIGIFLDAVNLHQINIVGCHVSYNGGGGIVVRASEVRNLQIGSCDIEGNMSPDGEPTANVLLDARVGSIREGAIVGCTIQHTHDAPESANIRLVGRGPGNPDKVGIFSISDNALSDVAVNVHLVDARGVIIVGNTFWKGFGHNILVERSSNVLIGTNLLDRNPDYLPGDSRNGVELRESTDCTLRGLRVRNAKNMDAAIVLRACRDSTVDACSLLDSACGVLLDACERVAVRDCIVRDRTRATKVTSASVRVQGGSGNWVLDNIVGSEISATAGSATVEGNRVTTR